MAVTLRDFIRWLEELIPPALQEAYDNSGLQVGSPAAVVDSVLITLDVTMEVISEAEKFGCSLIISHHPLIFAPLKRLAEGNNTEMCVAAAIRKNIAVYSAHTSFDNVSWGVSNILAGKLGLQDIRVLVPLKGKLSKMVTFVPSAHAEKVRDALFSAGAGHIGNYDRCSFNVTGEGTYRAGRGAMPFAGAVGEDHAEKELRIEAVMPAHRTAACVRALLESHPYEEVAYDIIALENEYHGAGAGAIGTLAAPMTGTELLARLRQITGTPSLRYSGDPQRTAATVAVCGGSGAALTDAAARAGADAFITGDIKYHSFAEAPGKMLLVDVGHYESEIFSLEILHDLINKKFPKFALRFSGIKTNPINYF